MSGGLPKSGYVDVEASVRHNTGSAAVAAGLLIFFGFIYPFARHDTPGLFGTGESILFLTFRLGCLVMVGVTVWLSFGHLPALAADAVASVIAGALIGIAGVLMLLDGGWWMQALIISVSGATFLSSGLRNLGDYIALYRVESGADEDDEDELAALSTPRDSPLAADVAEQRVITRQADPPLDDPELVELEPAPQPTKARSQPSDAPIQLDGSPVPPPAKSGENPAHSSSESYLARLARKEKRVDR